MIGQLRGQLSEKRPNQVLIDVNGVGYLVQIPFSTFSALGDLRGEVTLLIHTHVREDQLALYGFLTSREKHFFELLLSVSGVGPVLALKILSGMNLEEIITAVRKGDLAQLVRIPGVGRKTAERIVLELRDKLAAAEAEPAGRRAPASDLEADVLSALLNLGYERRDAERAVDEMRRNRASTTHQTFETLLRAALQRLSPSPAPATRKR
jgi:Holliday junction DNA helicase RuvA